MIFESLGKRAQVVSDGVISLGFHCISFKLILFTFSFSFNDFDMPLLEDARLWREYVQHFNLNLSDSTFEGRPFKLQNQNS